MTTAPSALARILSRIAEPPVKPTLKRVELDPIDALSLVAAASWNVNYMILDRFLKELGFHPRYLGHTACRVILDQPVVVLVSEFQRGPRSDRRAHLLFVEVGRFRASAAYFEGAVALVREADVVTYPLTALDDPALACSSLYAFIRRDQHSASPGKDLPPAA
jgi:hypothetical protein